MRYLVYLILVTFLFSNNVHASDIRVEKLKNGLSYVLLPNSKTPNVNQVLLFKSGFVDDQEGEFGLTSIASYLLAFYHEGYKDGEINHLMQERAIDMSVLPTYDEVNYYTIAPEEELESSIKFMAEKIKKVHVNKPNIEQAYNYLAQLEETNKSVMGEFHKKLQSRLFHDHIYAKSVTMGDLNLADLTPEKLQNHIKKQFSPSNTILVISGSFDEKKARNYIKRYYGSLSATSIKELDLYNNHDVKTNYGHFEEVDKQRKVPLYSVWFLAPGQHSDKKKQMLTTLLIKEILVANGRSSLFHNLIDNNYYASKLDVNYSPDSRFNTSFSIDVELRKSVAKETIESALQKVLDNFREAAISEDELYAAKQLLKTKTKIISNDNLLHAIDVAENINISGDPEYLMHALADLDAITMSDIQEVSQSLFGEKNRVSGYLRP